MELSRRELIQLLLGAPALASVLSPGCHPPPRLPAAGQLLGQSLEVGHRLRDGFQPQPDVGSWQDLPVVIVGGGVSGLSAAWRFRQRGFNDFVVLELEPDPGGTVRSGTCSLCKFPWGAHYVPAPLPEHHLLIQLLADMGVVESTADDGTPVIAEQFLCREPEERLFFGGEWIDGLYPATGASPDDLAQLDAFRREVDRWVEWRDSAGRRAFAVPSRLSSDDSQVTHLDQDSVAEWLRRQGWNSPRLHWLVDYSCRDDYGLSAEQTSAWAGLFYFAARQRTAGSGHQPLITWPEGNSPLISHLLQNLGTSVRTGAAVTQIRPVGPPSRSAVPAPAAGARPTRISPAAQNSPAAPDSVEVVWYDTQTREAAGIRARHVIFAAPQFLAPRLIADFTQRTGRQTDLFRYGSWFVANLHLQDRPREGRVPLSWDNVIHDSRSLGYVVATHQTGLDHGPTVLTWYCPLCDEESRDAREKLLQASWADLADVVLTDLERAHPEIRQLTTRLDVFRWGHAMVQPIPGFRTSRQRQAAAVPDGRIHFAHSDLSGIALFEEAFDHGCRAADEVLEAFA